MSSTARGFLQRWRSAGIALALLLLPPTRPLAGQPWTIHEWGTFTSLQDETGNAIGGINTDDEPVPKFVHRLGDFLLLRPTEVPPTFCQGAPGCHPDVTMRLETPVIYFHPPPSETGVRRLNVRVRFRGGWLTEYFPDAEVEAPGLTNRTFQFGPLRSETVSRLDWNELGVGVEESGPQTTSRVWTAPRAVQAAAVRATNGECEKFLFYRGVAHIDAPLKISRDSATDELVFHSQLASEFAAGRSFPIQSLWLADIRADGNVAFRRLARVVIGSNPGDVLLRTSASFAPADFSRSHMEGLKTQLQEALVADGLFADEAQALLNTWELSYFQSPGRRVFFLVPRAWTDFYLPLEVSVPANLSRVMVGRIELVTPEQRRALADIARLPQAEITNSAAQLRTDFYRRISESTNAPGRDALTRVDEGLAPLASWVKVPKSYQTYLSLGRFRNALLLDEARRRPAAGLDSFIQAYGLQGYRHP